MTSKIKIGNRWVGDGEPTMIIAEAGSNHDGKLSQAKELVDAAAEAGCDVIKFQLFSADTLYTKADPVYSLISDNEMPRDWVEELASYSVERNIIFTVSPFDRAAVDQICDAGAPVIKWASPEIHDLPLLRYAATKGLPILISTGMSDLVDIHHAVAAARSEGNNDLVLLHCVSSYPTPAKHINLRMMDSIRNAFDLPVGLSDHTTGIVIPAAAVARGACVIEKHFTLSRDLTGPDHPFAIEPGELAQMVQSIRDVEVGLGSSVKRPVLEVENLLFNHKSVVSAVSIPKGTVISLDMLTVKRAQTGIKPVLMDLVVGRAASQDIGPDEIINWDSV